MRHGRAGRRLCPASSRAVDYAHARPAPLFLRHLLWERLIVNVAIVLVFAAFYFRFLKRA
jgi:hypothetical protein